MVQPHHAYIFRVQIYPHIYSHIYLHIQYIHTFPRERLKQRGWRKTFINIFHDGRARKKKRKKKYRETMYIELKIKKGFFYLFLSFYFSFYSSRLLYSLTRCFGHSLDAAFNYMYIHVSATSCRSHFPFTSSLQHTATTSTDTLI